MGRIYSKPKEEETSPKPRDIDNLLAITKQAKDVQRQQEKRRQEYKQYRNTYPFVVKTIIETAIHTSNHDLIRAAKRGEDCVSICTLNEFSMDHCVRVEYVKNALQEINQQKLFRYPLKLKSEHYIRFSWKPEDMKEFNEIEKAVPCIAMAVKVEK